MKGTIEIEFEGNNCLNCPHCYHSSTFDSYICTAKCPRDLYEWNEIQGHVEYPGELGPRPYWCPITVEE